MSQSASVSKASAPVYIELVRIRNFRGLAEVDIELEPNLTLLVGPQ